MHAVHIVVNLLLKQALLHVKYFSRLSKYGQNLCCACLILTFYLKCIFHRVCKNFLKVGMLITGDGLLFQLLERVYSPEGVRGFYIHYLRDFYFKLRQFNTSSQTSRRLLSGYFPETPSEIP